MGIDRLDADVLLLEDDVLSAKLITVLLTRVGIESVQSVSSTEDAIKLLRRAAAGIGGRLPKAIIADIMLADEDSSCVLEWIRTSSATATTYVLAISAHEEDEYRRRAIDGGADAFVTKREFLSAPSKYVAGIAERVDKAA